MREAVVARKTNETDIRLTLCLDGGAAALNTGVGFLDHMLTLFAFHGGFGLDVKCAGDIRVDDHHTVEDIGIALGKAFSDALSDRSGIARYGSFILPMDETLMLCAVDIGGRSFCNFDVTIPSQKVGTFDTELAREFFAAFSRTLGAAVHLKLLAGYNSHHIIEAAFKSFGRAMAQACAVTGTAVPSSKGTMQ